MASNPDASEPPGHPSSSPVGSIIHSGSVDLRTPSRSRRERSPSYDDTPGPLIVDHDVDVREEHRRQEALRAALISADNGDEVSHPIPHDFNLIQDTSASHNGEGEDMTDEDFWAQLGEEVPEWAKQPPNGEPQIQDDGFTDLLEEDLEAQLNSELGATGGNGLMDFSEGDLEAQLDSELGATGGNGLMDFSEGDLEAQLDAELTAGNDNDTMAICEQDLEAQLNAELEEAETNQEEAAEAARREAALQEELRIAAEKAALAAPRNQRDDPSSPTEEELQAELDAGDAADGLLRRLNSRIAGMSGLRTSVNRLTVKRYSKKKRTNNSNKRARKNGPSASPQARVGRSQPPPMRKTDELPQMYHHGDPDWYLLRKNMNLSTRVDLNHCYRSLGLDVNRGKAVYESLKEYLRIPGNSVDLSAKEVDAEGAKNIIAGIAHHLLVDQRWGMTYFQRPSLDSGCKQIIFENDSTEVFLEFTSLVYKAMKLEEKRKKGRAKQQEDQAAREAVQHPTSESFATATYLSPQAIAQPLPPQVVAQPQPQPPQSVARSLPPQAPTRRMAKPVPVFRRQPPQLVQQQPRRQATINGMVIAPRSVSRVMPC